MWGQAAVNKANMEEIGIIPTRVGTSIGGLPIGLVGRDHPHACGDKVRNGKIILRSLGSSPRVWGQDSRDFIRLH